MMSVGLAFWIVMLVWLVFGVWTGRAAWFTGGSAVEFIAIALLGWKVFGAPLHG